jgi:hypothetical protein
VGTTFAGGPGAAPSAGAGANESGFGGGGFGGGGGTSGGAGGGGGGSVITPDAIHGQATGSTHSGNGAVSFNYVPALGTEAANSFAYTGTIEFVRVATAGMYDITADGAQGGSGDAARVPGLGGLGAMASGLVFLSAGALLEIVGGGTGANNEDGGGGGGSFVIQFGDAGGGGGGSTGSGGGGRTQATGGTGGASPGGSGGTNGKGGQVEMGPSVVAAAAGSPVVLAASQ